ncbi:MAG: metallophosphoesterase family protein [Promethearchaeota archaeon]
MSQTKFIHIADLHLGKRQYNLEQRYKDSFRAFQWILDYSIEEKVDFILIAGDIFDKRKVDPRVLTKVFYIIQDFKKKSKSSLNREIPIICIEGNHDNPIYSTQSWMTFLADLDLILLLNGQYNQYEKRIIFEPFDKKKNRGGVIKVNGTRIYGLPFFGSSTAHLFEYIYESIETNSSELIILMMHFGIDGYDSSKPGIEISDSLKKIHEKVDYLALGHYHKMYRVPARDSWIFNPGSLEITDIKEKFEGINRGIFLVTATGKELRYRSIECDNGNTTPGLIPNRKFWSMPSIDISACESFDKTIDFVLDMIRRNGIPELESSEAFNKDNLNCPILFFNLTGDINYSRLEVNINHLRQEIMKKFAVLDVRVFSPYLISNLDDIKVPQDKKSLEEIETDVFRELIKTYPKFENMEEEVVELMKDIKRALVVSKPNYNALKEYISTWCIQNASSFNISTDLPNTQLIEKIEEQDDVSLNTEMHIEEEDDEDEYIDTIEED